MADDGKDLIWVCANCYQASCWAGIFMCDKAVGADLVRIPKWVARKLGLEHEDYIQRREVQAERDTFGL